MESLEIEILINYHIPLAVKKTGKSLNEDYISDERVEFPKFFAKYYSGLGSLLQ
jgi:hypothetical protein